MEVPGNFDGRIIRFRFRSGYDKYKSQTQFVQLRSLAIDISQNGKPESDEVEISDWRNFKPCDSIQFFNQSLHSGSVQSEEPF